MKKISTLSLLLLIFQFVEAKKIDFIIYNDINKKIRIDVMRGQNNVDAGNILWTSDIEALGNISKKDVPIPKNSFIKVVAKVIETGENIEIPWEKFDEKLYSRRVIKEANSENRGFDFKDLTSIDNLFKYDPKQFVRENRADVINLKPLNNLYEEYLGGLLLFTLKGDSVNYITHISPKSLGTVMLNGSGGGTTYTYEFDFKNDLSQKVDASIVNLFEIAGSLEINKFYHFKIAYNSVGSIKYTAPNGTTLYDALNDLDSSTIRNLGMLKYQYGDKLLASQITEGYGFNGIYAEVSEYNETKVTNEISYNTFVNNGGYFNRSLKSSRNTVIAPSYLGYYANTNNHVNLDFFQVLYISYIITALQNLDETKAKIYYAMEKRKNKLLPEYTTKEKAIEELAISLAPIMEDPQIKSAMNFYFDQKGLPENF
jgi:hypothetical protein